jgi:hypothetical protein
MPFPVDGPFIAGTSVKGDDRTNSIMLIFQSELDV